MCVIHALEGFFAESYKHPQPSKMLGGEMATWKLFLLGSMVPLFPTHTSQPWGGASIHLAAV